MEIDSVIDLEANKIADMSQVDNLGTCPVLNCVTFSGCPIVAIEGVNYRRRVAASISNLITLDDIDISGADQQVGFLYIYDFVFVLFFARCLIRKANQLID